MNVLTTPEQINMLRLSMIIKAMEIHIKTDGRMKLTRTATPANLRVMASEYTGKTYPRSRNGLEMALNDLKTIWNDATSHLLAT
jgi:hypothetical protein